MNLGHAPPFPIPLVRSRLVGRRITPSRLTLLLMATQRLKSSGGPLVSHGTGMPRMRMAAWQDASLRRKQVPAHPCQAAAF